VCVKCLFLRSPSRAPYKTPLGCAKKATYSDPPPRRHGLAHRDKTSRSVGFLSHIWIAIMINPNLPAHVVCVTCRLPSCARQQDASCAGQTAGTLPVSRPTYWQSAY